MELIVGHLIDVHPAQVNRFVVVDHGIEGLPNVHHAGGVTPKAQVKHMFKPRLQRIGRNPRLFVRLAECAGLSVLVCVSGASRQCPSAPVVTEVGAVLQQDTPVWINRK